MTDRPEPAGGRLLDRLVTIGGTVVGTWLAALTAVLAAFLSALRIGGILIPVSWAVVVVGIPASVAVVRLATSSRLAVLFPVATWLFTLLPLTSRRAEGDVVVPGTWVGYGTVLIGIAVLAVTVFVTALRPATTRSGIDGGAGDRTR